MTLLTKMWTPVRDFARLRWLRLSIAAGVSLPSATFFSSSLNVLYLFLFVYVCAAWLLVETIVLVVHRKWTTSAFATLLIPMGCLALLLFVQLMQIRYAEHGMITLADSCEAFHRDHDRYPKSLAELVPIYVEVLPKAGFGYLADDFQFDTYSEAIYFSPASPFERLNFHVSKKEWSYYVD